MGQWRNAENLQRAIIPLSYDRRATEALAKLILDRDLQYAHSCQNTACSARLQIALPGRSRCSENSASEPSTVPEIKCSGIVFASVICSFFCRRRVVIDMAPKKRIIDDSEIGEHQAPDREESAGKRSGRSQRKRRDMTGSKNFDDGGETASESANRERQEDNLQQKTLRQLEVEELDELSSGMLRQVVFAHCSEQNFSAQISKIGNRRGLLARALDLKEAASHSQSDSDETDGTRRKNS